MELRCVPQIYEWGKMGSNSFVARLLASHNEDFRIESDMPYAELWMGTHPNGESVVKETGQPLLRYLKENPASMGLAQTMLEGDLPFLFKILSIEKALSIQAHPDKELAQKLNRAHPNIYKDKNHKVELAIALTDFECLVGFRPVNEIVEFLDAIPELSGLFSRDELDKFSGKGDTTVAGLFTALMNSPEQKIKSNLGDLLVRLEGAVKKVKDDCLYSLLWKLSTEYPNDVGCFAIYFLNYIKLRPDEAVFLHAGLPHAYLSGDIVECMSCSDNVIRAGLTPKFRDVKTLCSMLDFRSYPPTSLSCKNQSTDGITTIYKTPVKDFGVSMIKIPPNGTYLLPRLHSCSILIVVEGSGSSKQFKVETGNVVFFGADTDIMITNTSSNERLKIFQSYSKLE